MIGLMIVMLGSVLLGLASYLNHFYWLPIAYLLPVCLIVFGHFVWFVAWIVEGFYS